MNPAYDPVPRARAQRSEAARVQFFLHGDPAPVLHALTEATDAMAIAAYTQAAAAHPPSAPVTLLAIGNYARGLTFPYSSVDLLLLTETPGEALAPLLAAFTRQLWDQDLRLYCHARPLAHLFDLRPDNRTLLLAASDRRWLSGAPLPEHALASAWEALITSHGPRLRRELAEAVRARYAEFHHTTRALTPDLKRGPGGLDDLHLLHRVQPLGGEAPAADLAAAARLLAQARCYLHFTSGHNQNRLDAAAAEALAAPPFSDLPPEVWMRELYHQLDRVWRQTKASLQATTAAPTATDTLLGGFYQYRSQLSNADFGVMRAEVTLRQPARLLTEPGFAEQLLEFLARHGLALAPDSVQRLQAARETLAAHWASPAARWDFLRRVLTQPHPSHLLRALNSAELLPLLLPPWSRIDGWALRTPERAFAADEHALRALEALESFRLSPTPPFATEAEPAVALALLLGDHPHLEAALEEVGAPPGARAHILAWRDRQPQLEQELTARDLSEPAAGARLAAIAGSIEDLESLLVLIHARWTAEAEPAPAALAWRLQRLGAAYPLARAALTRGLETDRIDLAADAPVPPELLRGFPARYLRVHTPEEMRTHVQLYEQSRATGVAVRLEPAASAYQLTVIAPDRAGLFASFAGALSSFGMNILKAEAFTNRSGVILDTFVFADPHHMLRQNPPEADRLTDLFRRVGLGKTDALRLMRSAPAPAPRRRATAQLRFEDLPASASTLIEIDAEDRPGLLYALAANLAQAGCDIHVVLIDTRAGRAHDVFYVAHQGQPLNPQRQASLRESLLNAC